MKIIALLLVGNNYCHVINLERRIREVEEKHYNKLCSEVQRIFIDVWMPSHSLEHHKRVWIFTKELLGVYANMNIEFSLEFIEALILAVFFHDSGLSRIISSEHGKESAAIARVYLSDNSIQLPTLESEMIEAIELHDNKEYYKFNELGTQPSLYSLLTVADDLDAFGAIGVYRYLEIYSMRGISIKDIVPSIVNNINKRQLFVNSIVVIDEQLQKKHLNRFELSIRILQEFTHAEVSEIVKLIKEKRNIEAIKISETSITEKIGSFVLLIQKENHTFVKV